MEPLCQSEQTANHQCKESDVKTYQLIYHTRTGRFAEIRKNIFVTPPSPPQVYNLMKNTFNNAKLGKIPLPLLGNVNKYALHISRKYADIDGNKTTKIFF